MRLHSDTLTEKDLYAALPAGVLMNCSRHGSKKRAAAYEVTLYVLGKDETHRRFGNSGGYGASSDVAATWDEWGTWIDRLYVKDPDAIIAWYDSPSHFREVTAQHADYVKRAHKPTSVAARTHRAPWLVKTT